MDVLYPSTKLRGNLQSSEHAHCNDNYRETYCITSLVQSKDLDLAINNHDPIVH